MLPNYVTLPTRRERIATINFNYSSEPKSSVPFCNLSGTSAHTILTHRDRYGYPAQAVLWNDSGLVTLSPRMTPQAYSAFYAGIYRPLVSAYHGRLINNETLQEEQALYAEQLLESLTPFLSDSQAGHLLDIGGSTGIVAKIIAKAFGYKATVLDPAPDELKNAAESGFSIIPGFLEDLNPMTTPAFDVILLCQTIDHLLDIKGSLAKIRQILTPNGVFFVDIVDFRSIYLKHQSIVEAIKIDHPYYLVEETMEAYLKQAGFEILHKNYSADGIHIGYITRPSLPAPNALPDRHWIQAFQQEIQQIQEKSSCI